MAYYRCSIIAYFKNMSAALRTTRNLFFLKNVLPVRHISPLLHRRQIKLSAYVNQKYYTDKTESWEDNGPGKQAKENKRKKKKNEPLRDIDSPSSQENFARVNVELDSAMMDEINVQQLKYKYKKHPGKVTVSRAELPFELQDAVEAVMDKYDVSRKILELEAAKLQRSLFGRMKPLEENELLAKAEEMENKIISERNIVFSELKPGKLKSVKEGIFKEVQAKIHLRGNNWRPMKYNQHQSMVYMVARLDREYADLVRVFHEIKARDPEFKPGTLFDFGSGTGSVMWAANTVFKNSIWEHFLVDNSVEMHDLAKLLLHGGDPDGKPHFKNVYFRYNMPETLRYQNDLVVSAFSLFELSSKSERLEICEQMWKRTKPGGYMVLMELASKTAHTVMMEARDHILKLINTAEQVEEDDSITELYAGHLFAPCPHTQVCPRTFRETTKCVFETPFKPMMLYMKSEDDMLRDRFTYLIFKKEKKPEDAAPWPRVVYIPQIGTKHIKCHLCCADGKSRNVVFTARTHGREVYKTVKRSRWGDMLPFQSLEDVEKSFTKADAIKEKIMKRKEARLKADAEKSEQQPELKMALQSMTSLGNADANFDEEEEGRDGDMHYQEEEEEQIGDFDDPRFDVEPSSELWEERSTYEARGNAIDQSHEDQMEIFEQWEEYENYRSEDEEEGMHDNEKVMLSNVNNQDEFTQRDDLGQAIRLLDVGDFTDEMTETKESTDADSEENLKQKRTLYGTVFFNKDK